MPPAPAPSAFLDPSPVPLWWQVEMAACPDVPSTSRLVVGSVMLLLLNSNAVWGNYSLPSPVFRTNNTTNGPNIAAIVAPIVTLGVLAIVLGVVGWLLRVVKKRRQTEGTYRPSAEEQTGAKSVVAPDALKLPKEERLI